MILAWHRRVGGKRHSCIQLSLRQPSSVHGFPSSSQLDRTVICIVQVNVSSFRSTNVHVKSVVPTGKDAGASLVKLATLQSRYTGDAEVKKRGEAEHVPKSALRLISAGQVRV